MFEIPKSVKNLMNVIRKNGYEAYIVGGCVRDMLLCRTPSDFDVTTSAMPKEILGMFERTVSVGIKHGTVGVVTQDGVVEVTTFRSDGDYNDCRRPESVKFVRSLKEDLARRDFTVNAMAYSDSTGLIDCFGGREDIKNRILRTVGEPKTRFSEDALRILRLFRFACTLGFTPEESTLKAAVEDAYLLEHISRERIYEELSKASLSEYVGELEPLIKSGGLNFLGICGCAPLNKIGKLSSNRCLRLFALLNLCDCEDIVNVSVSLKAPKKFSDYCAVLLNLIAKDFPTDKTDIKEMLNISSPEMFEDYLEYERIILERNTDSVAEMKREIERNGEPYRISDLAVSGNDVKKLGFKGTEIGAVLEKIRKTAVIDPKLNQNEYLLQLAKELTE